MCARRLTEWVRYRIDESKAVCTRNSDMYFQITFHRSCTNLHSHRQCMKHWLNLEKKKKTKHFFWSSTARFLVILHCRQIAATSIWVVTTSTSCSVYRDIVGILWASPEVTVLKFLNTSYDSRPCAPNSMVLGSFPWSVIISAVSWNLNLFVADPCRLKCEWSINKRRPENIDLRQ